MRKIFHHSVVVVVIVVVIIVNIGYSKPPNRPINVLDETTYETPLSQSPLFPLLLLSVTRQKHSPDCSEKINSEYDYVIVGGGTAGSVVAGRLSEEPCISVLLLEAGPKPPLISEIPVLGMDLIGTDVDWKFQTIPQKQAAIGFKNKKVNLVSGKMLGGSGNLNNMFYARGNHRDYNEWTAQGAKGWSYDEVLPYFLKLEDNRSFQKLGNGYHHFGGPITVEDYRYNSKFKATFYEAAKELGYDILDSNAATQTGFDDYQMNMRDGQRCSSVKGYLVPAENRPNLDIFLNATVTKVIIKDKRANGVEFYYNGELQMVKARKEVIVSSGVINTPKLLMLSGIGPRKELEKWKIPVVSDLPVGENLQDQGVSAYFFTIDPEFTRWGKFSDYSTIQEYIDRRTGILSDTLIAGVAFLNGLNVSSTTDFPNYLISMSEIEIEAFIKYVNSSMELELNRFFAPVDGNQGFCACLSQHLHPRSRGTITLSSTDPFDPPVIDPNYLEDSKDLDDIVEGLRMCKTVVDSKVFQRLGAKPLDSVMPGCENEVESEEDYFKCYARRYFTSSFHGVGTAKMGDPGDPSTVVDPQLRVKGVKGLRVIDASVMPIVPSANTNIPTIMIAEKASDIIRKTVKCFKSKGL